MIALVTLCVRFTCCTLLCLLHCVCGLLAARCFACYTVCAVYLLHAALLILDWMYDHASTVLATARTTMFTTLYDTLCALYAHCTYCAISTHTHADSDSDSTHEQDDKGGSGKSKRGPTLRAALHLLTSHGDMAVRDRMDDDEGGEEEDDEVRG